MVHLTQNLTEETPTITYDQAPALDIVSFGYQNTIGHLVPLLKMSLPLFIIVGIVYGLCYESVSQFALFKKGSTELVIGKVQLMAGLYFVVVTLINFYLSYCNMRYIRDAYKGTLQKNIFRYLLPSKSLLVLILLNILFFVANCIFLILITLGFVLLVIPGIVIMFAVLYIHVRLLLISPANPVLYFMEEEKGVIHAIKRSWKLTQNNFWRTVLVFLVVLLLQLILISPFSIISYLSSMLTTLKPAISSQILFKSLHILLLIVLWLGQYLVYRSGSLFVWSRYYLDLNVRYQETQEAIDEETTSNQGQLQNE